jgi:hypothetical protein
VTKPVIVTKKQCLQVQKKSGSFCQRQIVKPILKKEQNKLTRNEVIESTSVTYVGTDVIGKYISQYKDIAMSNMRNLRYSSIILAQGILESGAGRGDLCIRPTIILG